MSEVIKTPENLTNGKVAKILANHREVWTGGTASDEQMQEDKQIFEEQYKSLAKFENEKNDLNKENLKKKQQEFEIEYDKLNQEILRINENSELNLDQKVVEKDKLKARQEDLKKKMLELAITITRYSVFKSLNRSVGAFGVVSLEEINKINLQNPYEFNWNLENSKLNRLCWESKKWIAGNFTEPTNIKKEDLEDKSEEEKVAYKAKLIQEGYQNGIQKTNAYFYRVRYGWEKIEELRQSKESSKE